MAPFLLFNQFLASNGASIWSCQLFLINVHVFCRDIYASFGGLLMMLRGDASNANNFELDQRLFLLMRKV